MHKNVISMNGIKLYMRTSCFVCGMLILTAKFGNIKPIPHGYSNNLKPDGSPSNQLNTSDMVMQTS